MRSMIIENLLELAEQNGCGRGDIRYMLGSMRNIDAYLIRAWNQHFPAQSETPEALR